MAKKKAKRRPESCRMKFYTLKINEEDIQYLRLCVETQRDIDAEWMNDPPKTGTPDQKLEDWVIARDCYGQAIKLLQLIDRVFPKGRK